MFNSIIEKNTSLLRCFLLKRVLLVEENLLANFDNKFGWFVFEHGFLPISAVTAFSLFLVSLV